ncbi:MAG TPA: cytochrome d ubiquinol oxidase subunit II [Spirochaetota bacterium]|nr:cytochrome d ubiquinol oxidase subunit II [Spirochaetota bacterium]
MELSDSVYQIIWFILIGVLFAGYSILDGFDLGVGILFPFITTDDREKGILARSIGPVWDGNEVWLVTAGGALFAAFPLAYATVFSGFYLALMLVLFALIFRAVSLEFWAHDEKRRKIWSWAFFTGSLVPSLLFGIALGNVVYGVPLTEQFEFGGNFFTLLRPMPLLVGLLGLVAIIVQGSTYTAMKTEGQVHERARLITKKMMVLYALIFISVVLSTMVYMPEIADKAMVWIFSALVILSVGAGWFFNSQDRNGGAFLMSSLGFAGLWGITGSIHFPNMVRGAANHAHSITIGNSSSSSLTLKIMLIIALIGMPVVIAYSAYVYYIFKGKTTEA